jgi:hypothetical protein
MKPAPPAPKRVTASTRILFFAALAWAACSLSSAAAATPPPPPQITWNGLQWNVKSGAGKNPGLNTWSPANVSVDSNGDLHLAITNVGGTWTCAEVWTDVTFGFGTFQWQLLSAVDNLDPNVVLGLFAYGPPALGPDGTHEIDIEYSRFGSPTADIGRWTIFPNVLGDPLGRSSYPLTLGADVTTTSRFVWTSTDIAFATLGGLEPPLSAANLIRSWTYHPTDPATSISQSPMPVHMNLWLDNGNPPRNGQGVEVVIHAFTFSRATASSTVPALPGHRGAIVLAACLIGVGLFVSAGRARA